MKFKQSLTKVILLLFSFFFGSVPEQTPFTLSAAANSVDEELQSIGMKEDADYPLDIESNDEISTLLFLENKEKYYIYFYLPKGIYNYEFLTIQLGIAVGSMETINNDSNLEINNYSLNYIDMTSNGTVSKYEIQGIDSSLHTYSNRRYSIRQAYIKYSNELKPNPASKVTFLPYWQTLGDEYHYYKDETNKTQYNYKKANYVSLTYKEVWSYYFETTSNWQNLFGYIGGKEHYFYGFKADRKIEDLKEVEIQWKYRTISAYRAYKTSSNFDSSLYGQTGDSYSKEYDPDYGTSYNDSTIVLKGKSLSETKPFWFLSTKVEWDCISKYEDIINNADETFASNIKKNFEGADYIVDFVTYDTKFRNEKLLKTAATKYSDFTSYLIEKNADTNATSYLFYRYESIEAYQIQMVRMRYETNGKEYNLQVITDPIDSSGTMDGVDNPNLPWWLQLIIIVLILFVISLVIRILSPIFKLIGSIFKGFFSLFKKDK